jgi:hypothetical protein
LKWYVVRDLQKMQTGGHVKLVIQREYKCTIKCKVWSYIGVAENPNLQGSFAVLIGK